ncbi:hypothetical protein BX070DRAFT_129057 [Coemansia spiralis]|nr:hypothetical protein BX070DRAFT_129057 [Coemansia spiralis]
MDTIMPEKTETGKRVAVVGSGLAGLTAAYFLQKSGCSVDLFERSDSVGMDAGSVTVEGARIDVPFRVFTPDYYPYLYSMYKYLGIEFAAADYSLGFTGAKGGTFWSYTNMALGDYQLSIPDGIVRDVGRLTVTREWVRLIFACLKFVRMPSHSYKLDPKNRLGWITIGQYLQNEKYDQMFVSRVFIPFIASLLTCSLDAAAAYPANTILHFVAKVVFGARIRKAKNGVQEVCQFLTHGISSVHLNTQVKEMVLCNSDEKGSYGSVKGGICLVAKGGQKYYFDEVVLATPADTAAQLLSTVHREDEKQMEYPPSELLNALRSVPYEDTFVVTHRDEAVMPAKREEWRGVNIRTTADKPNAMASHWINYVEQTTSGRTFNTQVFQTVDSLVQLDKSKVVSKTSFHRSLVTVESQTQINTMHRYQGEHGIWLVGTYTSPGVPLLEGCVRTSLDVVRAMGGQLPFTPPRLTRKGKQDINGGSAEYEVGLAPGMVRDEVVEAYFECDTAGTFAFKAPG